MSPTHTRQCRAIEESFASVYDGAMPAADRVVFDVHLASCTPCREGFAQYVRSISDLSKLRPGRADPSLVAQVMARIDRDSAVRPAPLQTASQPWRRFGTHFVAAAVGAAAAVAFWPRPPVPTVAPQAAVEPRDDREVVRLTPPIDAGARLSTPGVEIVRNALPVRFVPEGAPANSSAAHLEPNPHAFTLRPGDSQRMPSQRIEITLTESGELLVHVDDQPAVNEVRFVEFPTLVSVDSAVVDKAVDSLEAEVTKQLGEIDVARSVQTLIGTFSQLERAAREAEARRSESAAAARREIETRSGAASDGSGGSGTSVHAHGAFSAPTFTAGDSPVTIRRSGDRAALSIQGSLAVTIPVLIELLDNDDAEVADLAAARLDGMRRDLESDPRFARKLTPLPSEYENVEKPRDTSLRGMIRNPFSRPETVERRAPTAERWATWWRDNAIVIATGAASDT